MTTDQFNLKIYKNEFFTFRYSLNNREAAMLSRENVNSKIMTKKQYWGGMVRNKY